MLELDIHVVNLTVEYKKNPHIPLLPKVIIIYIYIYELCIAGLRQRCVKRNGYKNLYVVTLVLLLSGVVTFLPIRNSTDHKVEWRTRNLLEVTRAPPIIDTQNTNFFDKIHPWLDIFHH